MGITSGLTAGQSPAQASRREKTNQAAMSGTSAQAAKTAMAWPWVRNWGPSVPHTVVSWNGSETASETMLGKIGRAVQHHGHLLAASWRGPLMMNRMETITVIVPAVERIRKPSPRAMSAMTAKTRPEPQM